MMFLLSFIKVATWTSVAQCRSRER